MFLPSCRSLVAAAALLCTPLLAGDYDHLFDVVKTVWPERVMAMAICDKDANQLALIDLADTAKAHGISLTICDLRDEKDYAKVLTTSLARNPGFLLILDDDTLLGGKGKFTARLIYRASGREIPSVGISKDALKAGAILVAGTGPKDKVYGNKEAAKRMKVELPPEAVDAEKVK